MKSLNAKLLAECQMIFWIIVRGFETWDFKEISRLWLEILRADSQVNLKLTTCPYF